MMSMQSLLVLALAFSSSLVPTQGTVLKTKAQMKEHPIEGVISLLQDLQAKAKDEHAAEAANYQKFAYWCKNSEKDLTKSLAKHEEQIEVLSAKVSGAEKNIEALDAGITKLTDEIEKRNGDQSKADKIREEEAGTYEQEQADLKSTIDAFEQAIEGLEGAAKDQLLQTGKQQHSPATKEAIQKVMLLSESLATTKQQVVLGAFLQANPDAKSTGRVKKYDSKSGGVIEMLKTMADDFKRQLVDSTKEETNALNSYNLAKQAQDYAVSEAEETKAAKEDAKGATEEKLAKDKEALQKEEEAKTEETEQLSTVQTDCKTKAFEWEQRTKTREGEIAAMAKAIEILAKVTNVRNPETHEVAARLIQSAAASFLQLDDPKSQVMNLLRTEAVKVHSKALQRLAQAIASYDGPFDIINQKIQKMIFQLMAEQKDEDDHKAWCDLEVGKTEDMKEDREEKMKKLNLKIEDAESEVAKLIERISDNENQLNEVVAYIQEETAIRGENKAENKAAIEDAKVAQEAIANAKSVLADFYKKAGEPAEEMPEEGGVLGDPAVPGAKLVQTGENGVELPEQPETWDAGYTGVTDPEEAGTGVLAILARVGEDFAKMEAESIAQEEIDEKNFQADMTEQAVEKGRLEQDTAMSKSRKESLSQKLDEMAGQKGHLTKELEAVNQYLKDLEPACIAGDSSYEDRKQARADEIEALRKAQVILADAFKDKGEGGGGDEGFLQKKKGAGAAAKTVTQHVQLTAAEKKAKEIEDANQYFFAWAKKAGYRPPQ